VGLLDTCRGVCDNPWWSCLGRPAGRPAALPNEIVPSSPTARTTPDRKESMRRIKACDKGCTRFNRLKEDQYFQYCGPIVKDRRARGEPTSGYKKVGGKKCIRGTCYSGGSVEMLLKKRGWGKKAAKYYPVKGDPCVRHVGRDFAIRYAEARARFVIARKRRRARRAA